MKKLILTFFLVLIFGIGFAQSYEWIDSLKHNLAVAKQDTSKIQIMVALCRNYRNKNPDSAQYYGQKALDFSRKINFPLGEVGALHYLSMTQINLGNLPNALEINLTALQIAEKNNLTDLAGRILKDIGIIYLDAKDYPKALKYLQQAKTLLVSVHQNQLLTDVISNLGGYHFEHNQLDSAAYYFNLAYNNMLKYNVSWAKSYTLHDLGSIQVKKGNTRQALDYFQQSLKAAYDQNEITHISEESYEIAKLYQSINQDSCIFYAKKALSAAQQGNFYENLMNASSFLAEIYEKQDAQKTIYYNKITLAAKDSLYNLGKLNALKNITDFDEQERKYEIETATTAYKNQVQFYLFLAGFAIFSLIAFILYRNNLKEKKAKKLLHQQKEEIQTTLLTLKSTQAQLIQSEKLASLGELTAGIAHEIQNPLNFVNNFSEVSTELVTEMKEELAVGNQQSANEIADDLKQNLEKITLHGKRASSIVKGMLEHSKASSGDKEPTDINTLADEYLRLAYHGLRAKDKDFNSDFKTDFDPDLPKINIIPQDMGRVILNLINNAFWAVKTVENPLVVVKTEQTENKIIIKIKDNGSGIPENMKVKIFQPFFTTKPTGQGTGLGLSLAYDIVTKGHGGTLEVKSAEGVGSEFIITLPFKTIE